MSWSRSFKHTMTIARRDFTATVFTPAFLIFLLIPIIMFGMGPLVGMGASDMIRSSQTRQRLVVIASGEDASTIRAIDGIMRGPAQPGNGGPPVLRIDAPQADPAGRTDARRPDDRAAGPERPDRDADR